MCGIAGIFRKSGDLCRDELVTMTRSLAHRGPDDEGCKIMGTPHGPVGFGHTRLSILDLSDAGAQPMRFENFMITYNGEVYNFREIRSDLEVKGYSFTSDTDTEVVLKAVHCWGVQAVDRFTGMFAFAILDTHSGKLRIFRDRVGVKPLYYYQTSSEFVFGSELRVFSAVDRLDRSIDPQALYLFMQYGYLPGSYTIFDKVRKLLPGHYAEYDLSAGTFTIIRYWSLIDQYSEPVDISMTEASDELETLLTDAFRYRLISDVPVGIFLSGGFDSGCLAALLSASGADIKTYTMGFHEKEYDESADARAIADYLGVSHTRFICTMNDAKSLIPELPEIYDEPFGDSSALPTVLLSRLVRQEIKVALSADGGDELFGGYSRYPSMLGHWRRTRNWSLLARPALSIMNSAWLSSSGVGFGRWGLLGRKLLGIAANTGIEGGYAELTKRTPNESLARLMPFARRVELTDELDIPLKREDLDILTAVDSQTYLPDDVLVKVDRASMSQGLEAREPFLDQRIIQFAARLPVSSKLKDGKGKQILREIVYRHLPRAMMDRPKMGFGVPVLDWLRSDLRDLVTDILAPSSLSAAGFYNVPLVNRRIDAFLKGTVGDHEWIWFLLVFEMWRRRWA